MFVLAINVYKSLTSSGINRTDSIRTLAGLIMVITNSIPIMNFYSDYTLFKDQISQSFQHFSVMPLIHFSKSDEYPFLEQENFLLKISS